MQGFEMVKDVKRIKSDGKLGGKKFKETNKVT